MNIDINEMSAQEKSFMLARLCGWKPEPDIGGDEIIIHSIVWWNDEDDAALYPDPEMPLNLYDSDNMALSAKVMLWADENLLQNNSDEYRWLFAYNFLKDTRTALNNILKLAIGGGMVTK